MNERKLTNEEINQLFEFCEFHGVKYYDVQVELVDHLASAIEDRWKTNPEMPFEEAVFTVGEKFGVDPYFQMDSESLLPAPFGKSKSDTSGFTAIMAAKEKELRRKYEQLQWEYIKEFFRLPKIILTLAVASALFVVFRTSDHDAEICLILIAIYILGLAGYIVFCYPRKFKLDLIPGKSFLLYDHFRLLRNNIISLGSLPVSISGVLLNGSKSSLFWLTLGNIPYYELLFAFLITFFGIIVVVVSVYIPHRMKEDFTREFPQFVKN
jgi:hypothetical protein